MSMEGRMTISIAELRNILEVCVEMGYINEYALFRIMDFVKDRTC